MQLQTGVSHAEQAMIKKEINHKVNEWEERRWRTEVEGRETLEIYGAKKKTGGLYSNDSGSMTLFRCRTNALQLNWSQRFQGGRVDCPVCESGAEETLKHFLKECHGLGGVREIHRIREDSEIEEMRCFVKKYLEDLWRVLEGEDVAGAKEGPEVARCREGVKKAELISER